MLPILLSACGGGSSSSANTATTINGITVPPAPDPATNNATLAGVDSNNNGVRDDLERSIAAKIKNIQNYNKMLAYAKAQEKMITLPTPTNRAQALAVVSESYCAMGLSGEIERDIVTNEVNANTADRKDKLDKFNFVTGGYFGEEVSCN
jgi:hypothetical protein